MKRLFLLLTVLLCLSSPLALHAQLYDLVVSQDGTGDYTTIQDAVNAIRDYKPEGRQRILVKKGVYEEKVIIPSYKTNISLIGEDRDSTILIWHDHANMHTESGFGEDRRITSRDEGRKIGTFQSYTLRVDGPGFECENMTLQNDAMVYYNPNWWQDRKNDAGVAQAVTVHVEGDRAVFRNCRLLGFQDTLFNGNEDSRQMFYQCYIEGTVDFIFGPATVWFEQCHLHAITSGYYTAASTPANHPYGYVFNSCRLTAQPSAKGVYLGRPWRNYAAVIFKNCEMPAELDPRGWNNWRDPARELTARYYEGGSTGPGAKSDQRVNWAHQLSANALSQITINRVFTRPADRWAQNAFPTNFYDLHFAFYDENIERGTPYLGGTLEPKNLPSDPMRHVEDLVMKFDSVDCTTFVEYMSAALLGRVYDPSPSDSIMQRFVQSLRYHDGYRGNYSTRCHYFTDWIDNAERQGLATDITSTLAGAKSQRRELNFMSTHTKFYPQLATSTAMLSEIKQVERRLSALTTWTLPVSAIKANYTRLREGDIVAFVTSESGLDVQHVGMVWCRDPEHDEPQLLHASSSFKQVTISVLPLADYAKELSRCTGIRIIRLNR